MEGSAADVQFHVAVGLGEGLVVCGSATICIVVVIVLCAATCGEDSILAIEGSAIDGECGYSCAFFSIYVATIFTWCSILWPQRTAHIAATTCINSIDWFGRSTEDAAIDYNLGVSFCRVNIGRAVVARIVASIVYQIVFSCGVRTVIHRILVGIPVWNVCVCCIVGIITDTIHTTCTRTEDATKNLAFLAVVFRQNLEGTAIDGNGAIAIEWVVYLGVCILATTRTTTI